MYLMGRDTILELQADLQRGLGSRFNLRQFHDRFLSFGSIPVALVADIQLRNLGGPASRCPASRRPASRGVGEVGEGGHMRFRDKVAVVTGAGNGIGLGIAHAFAGKSAGRHRRHQRNGRRTCRRRDQDGRRPGNFGSHRRERRGPGSRHDRRGTSRAASTSLSTMRAWWCTSC